MGRDNREEWAKRVERWRDSGLTASEFADETGINPRTLSYWKWRLGRERRASASADAALAPPSPRSARPQPPRRAPAAAAVTFVEVAPTPPPVDETPPAASAAEPFEIAWPSGVRVRVPARFDDAALVRLLQAVR